MILSGCCVAIKPIKSILSKLGNKDKYRTHAGIWQGALNKIWVLGIKDVLFSYRFVKLVQIQFERLLTSVNVILVFSLLYIHMAIKTNKNMHLGKFLISLGILRVRPMDTI